MHGCRPLGGETSVHGRLSPPGIAGCKPYLDLAQVSYSTKRGFYIAVAPPKDEGQGGGGRGTLTLPQ